MTGHSPDAYKGMIAMANRFNSGVTDAITDLTLPWTVAQLGCRVEYWFMQDEPETGSEAASHIDADLDRYMHIASLNRGVLMTPFHNMALMCPRTKQADVDKHTAVFREIAEKLVG
jgi:glutamate-1-semialdehyde 2,1-aminomutase